MNFLLPEGTVQMKNKLFAHFAAGNVRRAAAARHTRRRLRPRPAPLPGGTRLASSFGEALAHPRFHFIPCLLFVRPFVFKPNAGRW
jgi:hypothetical protein